MTPFNKLLDIRKELDSCSKEVIKAGVDLKIGRAEYNYTKAVELNCNYILSRSNYKIFKALNRYNKKKEKSKDEKENNRGFVEII